MQPTTFPHWATWQHLSGVVRGGMPATSRPWTAWQGWVAARADGADRTSRRRMRLSLHDIADLRDIKVDWSRLPRPEITFYTPNQIRHLIRTRVPLPSAGWAPAPAPAQPPDAATQWRLADLTHIQVPPGASAPSPPPSHAWLEGAARGLPLGAIVLVLLVLIARVADKCLDNSFFFRRRRSVEWPAANVTATNIRDTNTPGPADLPHNELDSYESDTSQCQASVPDLPPPYSECARATVNLPRKIEEPPPPYSSACYVSFANPKAGTSVYFYNNIFGTSTDRIPRRDSPTRDLHIYGFDIDTRQTNFDVDTGQTNSENSSTDGCEGSLVFDNGRVVERGGGPVINYESANDANNSDELNVIAVSDNPTLNNGGVFIA